MSCCVCQFWLLDEWSTTCEPSCICKMHRLVPGMVLCSTCMSAACSVHPLYTNVAAVPNCAYAIALPAVCSLAHFLLNLVCMVQPCCVGRTGMPAPQGLLLQLQRRAWRLPRHVTWRLT